MNEKNYKAIIVTIAVLVLLAIGGSVLFALSDREDSASTSKASSSGSAAKATAAITQAASCSDLTAIITAIDTEARTLSLWEPGGIAAQDYTYTGATDFCTGYGRTTAVSHFQVGDFVDAVSDSDGVLTSVTDAAGVWSYPNVTNLVIDTELAKMSIADNIYRYDDSLLILNNGYFVGLGTLSGYDIFTVKGIDNYIYLIEVTSGHGYLTLNNYDDFIGGELRVGTGLTVEITSDLRLTLAEGEYAIIV